MATVQVKVQTRQAGGKGDARRLRMSGLIPGIVYGAGEENLPISLVAAPLEQLLRHISGNAIIDLEVEGRANPEIKVIIKDVQRNPIDQKILHIDLEHISMTRKVRVFIPVHLTGSAIGVKEGGILEHLMREIEVECLPAEIPEHITVDVTELARGNSIHVRDLTFENVHVMESPERVVVTVVGKTKEEEVVAAAPAEGAAAEGEAAEKKEGEKEGGEKKGGEKKESGKEKK